MKSTPPFDPTRRKFVQSCCAAVGTTGLLSALAQLRAIGAVAADASAGSGDYKALVCLFLNGGNDANNVIIPTDATDYAAYAKSRGVLAIPSNSLLSIGLKNYSDGRSYGLHPSLTEVQSLYNQGNLAFVTNVGTLLRPTTLADFQAGIALPPQLFSHSDQQVQWQSSVPDQPFLTGWGGRLADAVEAMNSNNTVSMSISVAGTNSFQVGRTVSQLAVSPAGATVLSGYGSSGNYQVRYNAMKALSDQAQPDLLTTAFGGAFDGSIAASEQLKSVLGTGHTFQTVFPGSTIGQQLKTVAQLIAAAPQLGLTRQIFFTQLYGWDMHGSQLSAHGPLLAELSAALQSFYNATVELSLADQVTTFTASDFGRTYTTNGQGTDHGWGNHQLVMGGAVKGGDLYGQMPSLQLGGPDDVGRGRWIPNVSVDQYSSTIAQWFGVSAANLPVVLPNLSRFSVGNVAFL
ncbi:MAG TPA: DUF1501 domain-containing protein [Opitutaceae bacterium]|jgi:uncharacterized protein (DUF1501 family)